MPTPPLDVLIIGAGPTGLTAAAEALRLGLSVRIVDRKDHRSTFSKALVMHARTLEALEGLALADRLVEAGAQFEALNVTFEGRPAVRVDLGALEWGDTRYPFWLSIPQYETERLLEERVQELGGAVDWQTSLVALDQDDDGVTAALEGSDGAQESVRARWLVGCDGGRSRTRELVGVEMKRQSLRQTFVLADARTRCDLVPSEGHAWHAAQGLLLIVPMPEPDLFRIIAHVPDAPDDLVLDEAFFDDLVRTRTGIDYGSHDLQWTSQFVLSQGLSERYRAGRVFLAGDAAHVHSPVGGQGMNTGIQDAHNLLWKLALARKGGDAEAFLASYEQERRPVAHSMVRGTGRATQALTTTNTLLRPIIGAVASRAAANDRVQQMLGRSVGMLDLGYARSSILAGRDGISDLIPGQRLPNVDLGERRLHDLVAGGHALLDFGEDVTVVTHGSINLGARSAGRVREALGVRGDGVVLVRPDRCVAGCWSSRAAMDAFPPARLAAAGL